METHLFVPRFEVEECLEQIRECLEKGWTGLGFKTIAFETAWKEYTGLSNAHFINSNTVGLHLALEIFKARQRWNDGDEVITTPLTFVSTNHSILHAKLSPVFADVDETLCLSPESVEARISPRTRAVMFVGMGGNTGRYDDLVKLCRSRQLTLILDAAHMAGTRSNGKHAGYDADASVFSFQAVKNLPTADSGMICFKEPSDDDKVRKLTWLGINKDTYSRTNAPGAYKWRYDVEEVGYKYHGNSIMAAIGLVQLKYLDRDNSYRRQLVSWYRQKLEGRVKCIPCTPGCESASHLFQIRAQNRDPLMLALNEHKVYPGVHYRDNIDYPMYAYAAGTCPEAANASKEIVSLPVHLNLTKADVDRVSALVIRYAL